MAKRFFLFCIHGYYPSGGMEDFHDSYDTETEALTDGRDSLLAKRCDWIQVWDSQDNPGTYQTYSAESATIRAAELERHAR